MQSRVEDISILLQRVEGLADCDSKIALGLLEDLLAILKSKGLLRLARFAKDIDFDCRPAMLAVAALSPAAIR